MIRPFANILKTVIVVKLQCAVCYMGVYQDRNVRPI